MYILPVFVLVILPAVSMATFSYDCYPNSTIVVDNMDPTLYRSSFANDSNAVCTTTYSSDYTELTITGCNLDEDILVVFTNRAIEDDIIIGGKENEAYIIHCSDISATGVTRSDIINFTPVLNTEAPVASINPTIFLEAAFRSDYVFGTPPIVHAELTTAIYLTIDIPVEYYGQPLDCTVKSGTDFSSTSAHSKLLISNGCSEDDDLMGNFDAEGISQGGTRRLYAPLWVFKFYNSKYLTLRCIVTYCINKVDCEPNCPARRRRSDASSMPSSSFKSHIAEAVLRVDDPISYMFSSATTTVPGLSLFLVMSLLLAGQTDVLQ